RSPSAGERIFGFAPASRMSERALDGMVLVLHPREPSAGGSVAELVATHETELLRVRLRSELERDRGRPGTSCTRAQAATSLGRTKSALLVAELGLNRSGPRTRRRIGTRAAFAREFERRASVPSVILDLRPRVA